MPIINKNAPAPNFEELRANMTNVHPDPNDHSSHIPHKVHTMSIEDVLSGKRFAAAQHVAWRYVFRGEDQENHVAEIGVDHTFHHINHGRHVDGFIDLIGQIDDHTYTHENSIVLEKAYEVSLLRIPSCYVMTVWFKGADHEHEFLVPLTPVHSNFEAGRHYEPDEFMDLLEMTAREMAASPAVVHPDVTDEAVEDSAVGEETAVSKDDLTRLLGVDARTAAILNEIGLIRFADVAQADPGQLMEILAEAGSRFRFDDPKILIDQAKLAAKGDWRRLRRMQVMLRRRYGLDG